MSTVAKFRSNQWFHVEDLHQRRGYHGSITVGGTTMVIGGNYGQPQEQTVGTEVLQFLEVTTAPTAPDTTHPNFTTIYGNTSTSASVNCGSECRIYHCSETSNSSIAEGQSVVYHGTTMEPKLHWSHATGFGLYEVDSNFCKGKAFDIVHLYTSLDNEITNN